MSILFGSRFLIIALVGAVFGDHAVLGDFIQVTLIVLTMMAARFVVDQIYHRLGGAREPVRLSKPPETDVGLRGGAGGKPVEV